MLRPPFIEKWREVYFERKGAEHGEWAALQPRYPPPVHVAA